MTIRQQLDAMRTERDNLASIIARQRSEIARLSEAVAARRKMPLVLAIQCMQCNMTPYHEEHAWAYVQGFKAARKEAARIAAIPPDSESKDFDVLNFVWPGVMF